MSQNGQTHFKHLATFVRFEDLDCGEKHQKTLILVISFLLVHCYQT